MSFMDEYNALKKKRKKDDEVAEKSVTSSANSGNDFMQEYNKLKSQREEKDEDEIFEELSSILQMPTRLQTVSGDIAPVTKKTLGNGVFQEGNKWYQGWVDKGAFSDGYDFGDISKTVLGTMNDNRETVTKAVIDATENLMDAAVIGTGTVGRIFSKDFQQKAYDFAEKDVFKSQQSSEWFINKLNWIDPIGVATNLLVDDTEEASVMGDKADGMLESMAHMVGSAALGRLGVPTWLTQGINAFSPAFEEAKEAGATDTQAAVNAGVAAVAEVLIEKLSGGIVSGTGADDLFLKPIVDKISNKFMAGLVKFTGKTALEGFEEVATEFATDLSKRWTYDKEVFKSEDTFDRYVSTFLSGAIMGAAGQGAEVSQAHSMGRNYSTGMTDAEFSVVDKLVNEEVAKREAKGKKVSQYQKNKIEAEIIEKMETGTIKVDEIESVLGGDSYATYKSDSDAFQATDDYKAWAKAKFDEESLPTLQKQYDDLHQMKRGDMTGEQIDKESALKSKIDAIKSVKISDLEAKISTEATRLRQMRDTMRGEVLTKVKDSRLAESYRELERSKQAYAPDMTKYTNESAKKTVQNIIDSGLGDNSNEFHAKVDLLAKVSADTGVTYTLTKNSRLVGTEHYKEGFTIHGFNDNGDIVINMDSKRLVATTAGHEVGHEFQKLKLDKKYSAILRDYCITKEGLKGYNDRIKEAEEAYKGKKDTTAEIEVANDLLGEYIFNDENFIMHLATADRNIFQKAYDTIKYMCKIATAGSEEKRLLEKAKHEFEKAWREIAKKKGTNAKTDAQEDIAPSKETATDANSEPMIDPENDSDLDYESPVNYSISVTDPKTIDFLENQEHITTYKAMVLIDGKLYPPMASKVKGEDGKYHMTNPRELGEWMQAEEDTTNIKFNDKGIGYYDLKKDDGGTVRAAYNPYEHSSNLVLNDQFEAAYKRDNLVTVECVVPVSEMNGAYKAEYAKDATGEMDWHSGVVAGKLTDNKRSVYLSRYLKATRILSDAEVAQKYKEIVGDISVPFNVVSPGLLTELENVGVNIDYEGSPQYQYLQRKAAEKEAKNDVKAQKNTTEDSGVNYSISKTSKMPYSEQLELIEKGKMNGSNSLYVSKPSDRLQTAGFSDKPFAMNQSDYRKSRRKSGNNKHYSSHAVPYNFFEKMPQHLSDAPMLIDNGAKVTVVTSYGMKDTKGNDSFVIAGTLRNHPMESDRVNLVKSVYPLDDFAVQIKRAADSGKLVVINKNKAEQMLATIGIQPAEVSRILNLAKNILSQQEDSVNTQYSMSAEEKSKMDADYLDAVAKNDEETLRHLVREYAKTSMPDSKLVTEDGNLREVYHGTNTGDFTVFNPDYIGMSSGDSGFFGMGFYFAYSKGEAAYYGASRVIPAYLDIKNPFNFDRELQTYNGKKAQSGKAPDAVALMNFADKFPDIAMSITLDVSKEYGKVESISVFEFAKAFKDVIENKKFEYQEVENEYGEKETLVTADPQIHSYEYNGETHTYRDFGFQKRWYGEPKELDVAYEYLSSSVYSYIDMPRRTNVILDNNEAFTAALKEMGYDGVIQSEYGDEAVAFEPSQIKSAQLITRDDNGEVIPLSKRFDRSQNDIRYSMSKADQDYFDAISPDNMDVLQKMVNDAAKEAGYTINAYHGTKDSFTVFKGGQNNQYDSGYLGSGFYFTDSQETAKDYSNWKKGYGEKQVMNVALRMENPLIIEDAKKPHLIAVQEALGLHLTDFGDYLAAPNKQISDAITNEAKKQGYDGIIRYSDAFEETTYVVFDSSQVKSTEPIVYADEGNIIPLSERFNKDDEDIRYSMSKDNQGNELSQDLLDKLQHSQVRDENGRIKAMYHGTPNGSIAEFKPGTYFTDNKEYADRYQNPGASSISTGKVASNPKTFQVYLDIRKPFDLSDPEAKRIYIEEYIKGGNALGINPYLTDAQYAKINTIDWTEGEDLKEFLIDNDYDYDGLVLDEGADGGYGEDVKHRGKSYVIFDSKQVVNIPSKSTVKYSMGYHAGDLGKSEGYFDMVSAFNRSTGHFGTGTYFTGDEAKLKGYNSRNGKPAPIETVDFDKYHLFKPMLESDGFNLHNGLKYINENISLYPIATMSFEEAWDARKNAEDAVYALYFDEEATELDKANAKATLEELQNKFGEVGYDPNEMDSDELYDTLINARRVYRSARNKLESALAPSLGYDGIEAKIDSAIKSVYDEVSQIDDAYAARYEDSPSTRFMKYFGYEGIDVRGFKGLDNTTYGSVIYDLKGEDLARKQEIGTAKYSMSKADDQYMEAVNNDDILGAEKAVEEYANLAMPDSKIRGADGKLLPVYHGTSNMFYEFAPTKEGGKNGTAEGFGIYLSDNQEVTKLYGDRQIKMFANITKPATSFDKTISRTTLVKLIKDTCQKEAQRMVDEDGYGNVREAIRDTWISNYVDTYSTNIEQAYREVAQSILEQNDNDKDIVHEVMFGMAIRDYDRAMEFYRESLTPVTGFDGFITEWDNPNTGETSTIYLAFDSSQLKSADAVTRDDNGNVIPLSERFDPTKKDIRFSISKDNDEYSPYREAPADFGYHDPLDDIAPVRDDIDSERREAFDALTDADVPPVQDRTPVKEITTVEERVQARIQNTQTELDNNRAYREQSYKDYDEEIAGLQAEYDSLKNKNTIKANNLLRRIERAKRMRGNIDADYAKRISDLEKRLEKYNSPEYKRSEQRRAKYDEYKTMWEEMLGDTSTWKDKALGLSYKTTTMRRFLRDVVRDEYGKKDFAKADAIYDELETKYDHHEALLKRESGKLKESFFNLKLNKHEDTYAHMVGEFRHNPETTLTQEMVDEYYNKHKKHINKAKVDHAIDEARKTFDSLIVRVNEVLREQGMKEIPYRKGYFPHFKNPKQGFLGKLLNWKKVDTEIPTSIAGLTENFNPERSWQSFNKQRKGDTTDYSLYQGLDTYIHGALDWIYHIEDIQKRRSLENYIRYIHSEEGVQARIDEIRANETYDADEAQKQIELVLDEASNPLNNLVTELRRRTNTLANKKASGDRKWEEDTNRKIYSTMTNINNRVNANMVVGSFSSALTNFIPIVQSWHQVSPFYTVRGIGDLVRSAVKDDGMIAKSDFLTNRLIEEEKLYQTGWDKVSNKAAVMMNVIDNITSQTVWRSKYLQNKHEGMSESQAIKDADQFAKNLIAGRSRGNMPTIFDEKNPFTKIFTAFQLEVANQYGFMFKDTPQDSKNAVRLVKGYATAFMGAYLYNALYSSITGRDAAFDPISIIEDLLRDLGFGEDEEKEETKDIILNFADNIVDEIPFVGSFTGGGRIPMSSAMPYDGIGAAFKGIVTDVSEEDYKSIAKEMLNPLYYLIMPVGGGQIKKTVEGLSMFSDDHPVAGSYTDSGALRFPVEDNFGSKVKAGLFGQWANKNARDYIENGRKPLEEKQIQEYIDLEMPIQDYWAYRDGLKKQETLEDKFNYIDSLDVSTEQKNIMINNVVDRKEQVDMERYDEMSDYEEFDFYSKNPEKYEFLEKNGISYEAYTASEEAKENYDNIYSWVKNNPTKVTVAKAVTDDIIQYKGYTSDLDEIRADKDSKGNSISGSAKEKKKAYIFGLDLDEGQKYILFKTEYPKDDTYNYEIIDYLNSRSDISYEEMNTILTELGFNVDANGYITWD